LWIVRGSVAGLIAGESELEKILGGFGFTEGPAWSVLGGFLVFSDIPGDTMWRWDEIDGLRPYRSPSRMANGNAFDGKGRLITCEHATSRVVLEENGNLVTVAEAHCGAELNSPNDVVVGPDSSIYFTDPIFGRQEYFGIPRPAQLAFRGLFRVDGRNRAVEVIADDFDQPNGLCFSPAGDALFVNDTARGHIRRFSVGPKMEVAGGDVWALVKGEGAGAADGMKCDADGRVFCSGPGGIQVFDGDGSYVTTILIPEIVGNFAWGGAEQTTLYVCASTGVYRLRTAVAGAATPWLTMAAASTRSHGIEQEVASVATTLSTRRNVRRAAPGKAPK